MKFNKNSIKKIWKSWIMELLLSYLREMIHFLFPFIIMVDDPSWSSHQACPSWLLKIEHLIKNDMEKMRMTYHHDFLVLMKIFFFSLVAKTSILRICLLSKYDLISNLFCIKAARLSDLLYFFLDKKKFPATVHFWFGVRGYIWYGI